MQKFRWGILLFTVLSILGGQADVSKVSAANGCGGSVSCSSTITTNTATCSLNQSTNQCTSVYGETNTVNCTITENDCYAYTVDSHCNTTTCQVYGSVERISCCGATGGGGGGCGGTCSTQPPQCPTKAPSGVSASPNPNDIRKADVTWTLAEGGGNKQGIFISTVKADVESLCLTWGNVCVVNERNLSGSQTSYTSAPVLIPGTVYYIVVANQGACIMRSAAFTYLSSCMLTPASFPINPTETQLLTLDTKQPLSESITFNFSSSDPGMISVSPSSDNSYQYQTTATGVGTGSSATITASTTIGGKDYTCSAMGTSLAVGPWWQVVDSDVLSNSQVSSDVPAGEEFGASGAGGYPGVVSYPGATLTDFEPGSLGTPPWLTDSTSPNLRTYDYQFFANQVPDDTVINTIGSSTIDGSYFESGGTLSHGYYWYKYKGSGGIGLTISSSFDLGSRKVVLLVEGGDLNIRGDVTLTDGAGFFGTFVNGGISVDPSVTTLEGIYLSDTSFETGTTSLGTDTALNVRGSVAAYGGVSLQRDIANDSLPSEIFEYAPDQILLFPSKLSARKISWKEVAP